MGTTNIHVREGELKIVPIVWFGEGDRDLKAEVVLDKPGSSAKVLCLFFARKGRLKLQTRVVHDAPNTFSRTLIRGVLDGSAEADYEGLVVINKGARNADADLNEHAILLSPKARANAIPRLEVLENEVKAGHGATVGKISEEDIFYLKSRGLTEEEAKKLIVRGFLNSFVGEFPEGEAEQIRNKLANI